VIALLWTVSLYASNAVRNTFSAGTNLRYAIFWDITRSRVVIVLPTFRDVSVPYSRVKS
jgi:hypothetical protein